jgi:hypothetical protein
MEKDKKNEEQDDVDYSFYQDQPKKLFPFAQENFNKNKFKEGIAILEQAILIAIIKYGGEKKLN